MGPGSHAEWNPPSGPCPACGYPVPVELSACPACGRAREPAGAPPAGTAAGPPSRNRDGAGWRCTSVVVAAGGLALLIAALGLGIAQRTGNPLTGSPGDRPAAPTVSGPSATARLPEIEPPPTPSAVQAPAPEPPPIPSAIQAPAPETPPPPSRTRRKTAARHPGASEARGMPPMTFLRDDRHAETPSVTRSVIAPLPSMPQPPATSNMFTERPSQQETPELRIVNQSNRTAVLAVWAGAFRARWAVGPLLHVRIPAGEYAYALYGPFYQATGRPDMVGRLRCRRYRLYETTLVLGWGSDTSYTDLGDPE